MQTLDKFFTDLENKKHVHSPLPLENSAQAQAHGIYTPWPGFCRQLPGHPYLLDLLCRIIGASPALPAKDFRATISTKQPASDVAELFRALDSAWCELPPPTVCKLSLSTLQRST